MSNSSLNNPRTIIGIAVILCLGWLVYREAINLIAWHFAVLTIRDNPNLDLTPTSLPDRTITQLNCVTIDRFGFSIRTPWKQLDKETPGNLVTSIRFKEAGGMLIFNPATELDKVALVGGKTEHDQAAMEKILGPQALSSNYAMMAAEMEARPDQVEWWLPASRNARNLIMLNLKSMDMHKTAVIYRFDHDGLRGFQFGNPTNPPYAVQLDIFDAEDRHYKMMIVGKNAPVISQPQINALIASLHPLPKTTYEPKPAPS
jgi:hypothetical protein